MFFKTEIKDFIKKVLLLGILLSFFINLLVTYFSGLETKETFASTNDEKFKKSDSGFLGKTGVAISLNIGTKQKEAMDTPINLNSEVLPISYILANKSISRNRIITSNMIALSEYLNILKTDINSILDQSSDRGAMLETFIEQLEGRYKSTTEQISILKQQATTLENTVITSNQKMDRLRGELTTAYRGLDYDKTQSTLDEFLDEKDKNTYANTYLTFIGKFNESYVILNDYNKVMLDTLINNKEALIKNVTVVMPDSGTNLMKKFNIVKTEAEFKSAVKE